MIPRIRPRRAPEGQDFMERRRRNRQLYETDPDTFMGVFWPFHEKMHEAYLVYLDLPPTVDREERKRLRRFIRDRLGAYEAYLGMGEGILGRWHPELRHLLLGLKAIAADRSNRLRLEKI